MLARIKNFFLESRHELKQVQWPTRRETIYLTALVIVLSAVIAAFLGGLDYAFAYLLRILITKV